MKRALVILAAFGLLVSPLMVSQAQAAPRKQHVSTKHTRKQVRKHVTKHVTRKSHKAAV